MPDREIPHESDAPAASLTPQEKLKPWAAYVLGHNSVFLRKWQILDWGLGGELGTGVGVPLTLSEIEETLKILAGEISAEIAQEIRKLCGQLEKLPDPPPDTLAEQKCDDRYWCENADSPGYQQWRRLIELAETVSVPMSLWQQLGATVATFQLDLAILGPAVEPGKRPSIQHVLQCAAKLYEQGWRDQPEVENLARCYLSKPWMKTQEILACVVNTPDRDLGDKPGQLPLASLLISQTVDLDLRLRHSLRSKGVRFSGSGEVQDKEHDLLVLTDLQKRILKALDGRSLTKEKLAKEVCGGDASRLYKAGALKELREFKLVVNEKKGRIGYYRPDAPPPGSFPRSQN